MQTEATNRLTRWTAAGLLALAAGGAQAAPVTWSFSGAITVTSDADFTAGAPVSWSVTLDDAFSRVPASDLAQVFALGNQAITGVATIAGQTYTLVSARLGAVAWDGVTGESLYTFLLGGSGPAAPSGAAFRSVTAGWDAASTRNSGSFNFGSSLYLVEGTYTRQPAGQVPLPATAWLVLPALAWLVRRHRPA